MTSESARTASTVILVSAGVAAAYVVLTTPPLRRLALVGMRLWLGASLPGLSAVAGGTSVGRSRGRPAIVDRVTAPAMWRAAERVRSAS